MKALFSLLLLFCLGFVIAPQVEADPVTMGVAFASVPVIIAFTAYTFKLNLFPSGSLFLSVCGQIAKDYGFDCLNPLQGGVRDRAWIINLEDYDNATKVFNVANPMILEEITLATGKQAYYVEGRNNSNAPSFALVKQTYANVFDHIFLFKIFDLSPETKADLQAGKDGKYVVIYENNFKGTGGNSAFEVLGAGLGLELTALTRDPNNADTQGAYDITFGSNANNKEGALPLTFFKTSYAVSKAAIELLLTPAP